MILGMDFSSLEETEKLGGRFYDNEKQDDLLSILKNNGINGARLRLWVEPYSENGEEYGAGVCDLPCVIRLAKRAKEKGMSVLLDLHYSDFWCDPARQLMPKKWRGLSLHELCERVYEYTSDVLAAMRKEGVEPELIQIGNEITNGCLWEVGKLTGEGSPREGYDSLAAILKAGIRAAREKSRAEIVLHLENSGNNSLWREWFDEITARGVDFDIIGASYYPFWHGSFSNLKKNLDDMAERYKKDIMIVETAYAFTNEPYKTKNGEIELVIRGDMKLSDGSEPPYPLTKEGQVSFVRNLLSLAGTIKGMKGVYYWEPAWLPLEGSTWATATARRYMDEEYKAGGNEWANQCIFDYGGNATPALNEFKRANFGY